MPYIRPEDQDMLLDGKPCSTGGELNFTFCDIIDQYIRTKGLSYAVISDIVGALEGAKAEFQRRIVGPYEDEKLKENGEVFTFAVNELEN